MTASMAPAAERAWLSLALALVVSATAFLLSYFRTIRKIVEAPDITPAVRGLSWLPPFSSPLDTAVTHFSIRTLLRSRQHRVILAFYLGIGFAVVTLGAASEHNRHVQNPASTLVTGMIASVIMMCASVIGTRVVFAMPIDLRANWVFRITEIQPVVRYLSASRRPLFALAVAPVCLISAAALFSILPWQTVAQHLVVLALWGTTLAYLSLHHFQKIPFTCSYLPGKSNIHMAIIFGMGLLMLTTGGTVYEFSTFHQPAKYAALVAGMTVAALAARWWTVAGSHSDEAEVQFEESLPPAVMELHIAKDGFMPIR
jgi:hypothetical protein